MKHNSRFTLTCGPYPWKVHEVHMEIIDQCIGIALYSVDVYTSARVDADDVHGLNAQLFDRSELVADNLVLNVARLGNNRGQSAFRMEIEAIERIHGLAELGTRRPFEVANLRVRREHDVIDIDAEDIEGDITKIRPAPTAAPPAHEAVPPPLLWPADRGTPGMPDHGWSRTPNDRAELPIAMDAPEHTRTEWLHAEVISSVVQGGTSPQTLRLTPGFPPPYELEPTLRLPIASTTEPTFEITQRVRFTELYDLHWKAD